MPQFYDKGGISRGRDSGIETTPGGADARLLYLIITLLISRSTLEYHAENFGKKIDGCRFGKTFEMADFQK